MAIRVLLVDPDEDVLEGFAKSLTLHGLDVLTASNEHECRGRLSEFAPNVVVLEPDVKGSWGRKMLEESSGQPPVIVVSRFQRDGAPTTPAIWLTKPVNSKLLASKISEAAAEL